MSELTLSPELLQISAEVQDALKNKKPVVALESTIISNVTCEGSVAGLRIRANRIPPGIAISEAANK